MVRTVMTLIAFAVVVSAVCAPADAARAVFEVPVITDFGSHCLSMAFPSPVARVNWVYVQAAGVTTYSQLTSYRWVVEVPDCAHPDLVAQDFTITIGNDIIGDSWMHQWIIRSEGAFAVADTLYPSVFGDPVLPEGGVELCIAEGAHVREWRYFACGPSNLGRACHECASGHTVFDGYPVVTVDYEEAVSNTATSWGSIKARYR